MMENADQEAGGCYLFIYFARLAQCPGHRKERAPTRVQNLVGAMERAPYRQGQPSTPVGGCYLLAIFRIFFDTLRYYHSYH